ncbi:hypothetical protein THAOC_10953, partial [Thalassiosira oceanica]
MWRYGITSDVTGRLDDMDDLVLFDMFIVAHEVGHSLGSGHTFDSYDPPVDRCDLCSEADPGATVEGLPRDNAATIMSYWQLLPGRRVEHRPHPRRDVDRYRAADRHIQLEDAPRHSRLGEPRPPEGVPHDLREPVQEGLRRAATPRRSDRRVQRRRRLRRRQRLHGRDLQRVVPMRRVRGPRRVLRQPRLRGGRGGRLPGRLRPVRHRARPAGVRGRRVPPPRRVHDRRGARRRRREAGDADVRQRRAQAARGGQRRARRGVRHGRGLVPGEGDVAPLVDARRRGGGQNARRPGGPGVAELRLEDPIPVEVGTTRGLYVAASERILALGEGARRVADRHGVGLYVSRAVAGPFGAGIDGFALDCVVGYALDDGARPPPGKRG